jgi:hypothetical protein
MGSHKCAACLLECGITECWPKPPLADMPKRQLQASQGDDRLVCQQIRRSFPHGTLRPWVDIKQEHWIRPHRGKRLSYGHRCETDCQYVRLTYKKKQGSSSWILQKEEAMALTPSPDEYGKMRLRAHVPVGLCAGSQYWSRLIAWFYHRWPGLTWTQYQGLHANHLNLNYLITLVDKLEICTWEENNEHYQRSVRQRLHLISIICLGLLFCRLTRHRLPACNKN